MAKRILIVDDEPRYLRLLEANLRTEGYEVVTAQDGLSSVEICEAEEKSVLTRQMVALS